MPRHIKKRKQSAKVRQYSYRVPDSSPSIQDKPIFSFHYLQDSHCISRCNTEQKAAFADTMRLLSKMTWQEIKSSHRHGLGSEKIPRHQFYATIPNQVADDEVLLSIRFYRRAPMVGIRRNQIFHIIWFDIDFDVYNHGS